MRTVLDTVVLVRALISPFGWWGRLVFEHAEDYTLVVSPPVVAEYLEVIRRPELTRKYRSLGGRDPHALLDLIAQAEVVPLDTIPAVARDPKDDIFLATAVAGQAEVLVSEDRDLLDLEVYQTIPIVTAVAFLTLLRGQI